MKTNKIFLFLLTVFCVGCFGDHVSIEPENRIEVTGNIKNSTEKPVEVLSFATETSIYDNYVDSSYLLGSAFTEASGNFEFISLKPRNNSISIYLNNRFSETYTSDLESVFIRIEGQRNNSIRIPDFELKETQAVSLNFTNTSGSENVEYRITYASPTSFYIYENGLITEVEAQYNDQDVLRGNISDQSNLTEGRIRIVPGNEINVSLIYPNAENVEKTIIVEPGISLYEIEY